ncbi:hypothetical protein LL912_12745 [Niabella sp. CC-SYL272]|uniref:hypothetical protein n=1 Tax=Niabella agricola TaxID=2891571 RepID=UPI001F3F61E5|nr:hypothetical protein [Niabella agricola]MCF3109640.1 hypothetical protein [Niabella agricola]
MKKRIVASLCCLGIGGLVFAFGDLLIDQENAIFKADREPEKFAVLTTSAAYMWWAGRGFLGVLLEMIGTVGLYLYLQKSKAEKWAFVGLLFTLTHQLLGIGVFAVAYFLFPAAGHLFLNGATQAMSFVTMKGALGVFFGVSLVSTLVGLSCMAIAVQKSRMLPALSGWIALLGFALIPVPGVLIQFLANTIWSGAYFWMALYIYKTMKPYGTTAIQPV